MNLQSLLIFAFVVISVKSQSACRTAIREPGKCVPIQSCSIIMDILTNAPKPWSTEVLSYLQRSYCEFRETQHYVCCAERHITDTTTTTERVLLVDDDESQDMSNHRNAKLLPTNVCGRISESKLSGGNATDLGEFPWMAQLQYETADGLKFQCGGTLISKRYVLTAAHCVVTGSRTVLRMVRLGEYDTQTEEDCEGTGFNKYCLPPVQDFLIEEVRAHPDYNKPKYANDIALIRLRRDVDITAENVLPICLPLTKELQENVLTRVLIAGWGLTEEKIPSNVLLKAVLPIVSNGVCERVFRRSAKITSSQLCAGGEKGIDSCRGDSGGPLFFSGKVKGLRYVQYGIVSVGVVSNCGGDETYPGIYARVSNYMKWILDEMRP